MNIFKHYWLYFIVSIVIFLGGLVAFAQHGLPLSIDFTGGTLLEISISTDQEVSNERIQELATQITEINSVQQTGQESYILRLKNIQNDIKDLIVENIRSVYPETTEIRFETVGPTLGRELLIKTLFAISIVAIGITWYIMRQFNELTYGISAVIAMLHDVLILFASFAILNVWFDVEIDVLFVTAILTTLSFSVHDTIVVYDRVRELRKKHLKTPLKELVSTATLETLNRSINNSMTIIFMLLALVLLGGETLRWFSVALLIGAVTGTYSSPFTAVPLLLLWEDVRVKLISKKSEK